MLLTGRTAIVTGGGRGIGRAIALRFAKEDAQGAGGARRRSEVGSVATEIKQSGGQAIAIAGDIAQESECERIVKAAVDSFHAIDILVNNAGIYGPVSPVEKIRPEDWDEVMAVNLRAPFLLSRLLLPGMY